VAQLRLRYKRPGQQASALIETPILADALRRQPSESARFASAVAGYADLLRGGRRWDLIYMGLLRTEWQAVQSQFLED